MNLPDGDTSSPALIKREKLVLNKNNNFLRDKNQHIHTIAIRNGWNTQVVHIFHQEHDGKFNLKGNLLSILTNNVELSHKWVLKHFKYQETEFYARLFYDYEEGPFEDPKVRTNVGVIIKIVSGDSRLYVFQDKNIACVFCQF